MARLRDLVSQSKFLKAEEITMSKAVMNVAARSAMGPPESLRSKLRKLVPKRWRNEPEELAENELDINSIRRDIRNMRGEGSTRNSDLEDFERKSDKFGRIGKTSSFNRAGSGTFGRAGSLESGDKKNIMGMMKGVAKTGSANKLTESRARFNRWGGDALAAMGASGLRADGNPDDPDGLGVVVPANLEKPGL